MVMGEPGVFIEENAPRDGIQNESALFSIDERVALIDSLSACGFQRIQIGSFVDPRWVPQMAETEKVYERIHHVPHVTFSALVLNDRGLKRALSCGIGHVSLFASASEAHSRKNSNRSVEEAVRGVVRMIDEAKSRGIVVQAGVMNAFGCRFEGSIPAERVLDILALYEKSHVDEINLADTPGIAHPLQVEEMISRVREVTEIPLSLHLHDTCGFGLANVYSAWKAGVRRFDASCGGLGGCPFIPGAAGNVATEDVVHLFQAMGASTGISLEKLSRVVRALENKMSRALPGRYGRVVNCGLSD